MNRRDHSAEDFASRASAFNNNTVLLSAFVAFSFITLVCSADPFPKGGRIVYIGDPLSRAPVTANIMADSASLYLEDTKIPRETGLFADDTALGFSFKVTAAFVRKKHDAPSNTDAITQEPVTVTKAYKFNVSKDGDGNVSIPLKSLPVVDTYPLFQQSGTDKAYISQLSSDIVLLVERSHTAFSGTMEELFKLSSSLPIPPPYAAYVNTLGKGFSDVAEAAVKDGSNPNPFASLNLHFAGGAGDTSPADPAGYYVVLMSTDIHPGPGVVDIDSFDKTKLIFDPAQGLRYDNNGCKNAYLVLRLVFTTDPILATQNPAPAILAIKNEGKVALSLASKNNIMTPNLRSVFEMSDTAIKSGITMERLGKAVEELNKVRSLKLDFTR